MMLFTKDICYCADLMFGNGMSIRIEVDTGAFITTLSESALLSAYPDRERLYDNLHTSDCRLGKGIGGTVNMVSCVSPSVSIAGHHLNNFYFLCRLGDTQANLLGMDFIGNCTGQFNHSQLVINTFDYNAYREHFYRWLHGVIPLSISKLDMLESAVSHTVSTPFDKYCAKYNIVDKDYEIRRLCNIYQVSTITDCYENIIRDFLS